MKIILLGLIILVASEFVLADGDEPDSLPAQAPIESGSDAQFDKRLPPVLPGEEVNDSGRRMKVWSTAGPVPVAPQPEPWNGKKQRDSKVDVDSVDVIVDQRRRRRGADPAETVVD